jgi:hypothetical protein
MTTPLAIVLTAVVLVAVSTLAVMNNACKSGRHGALRCPPYGTT